MCLSGIGAGDAAVAAVVVVAVVVVVVFILTAASAVGQNRRLFYTIRSDTFIIQDGRKRIVVGGSVAQRRLDSFGAGRSHHGACTDCRPYFVL